MANGAIEALDVSVLRRLARLNKRHFDALILRPGLECATAHLAAVVHVERFNRTYREELLDQYLFSSLDDVREATYWWMLEYN